MSTKCLFLRDYKVGTIVVSDFESIFRCSRTSLHRVAHRRTSRYISVIYTDFPHLHKIERTRTKSQYKVAPKVAPKKVREIAVFQIWLSGVSIRCAHYALRRGMGDITYAQVHAASVCVWPLASFKPLSVCMRHVASSRRPGPSQLSRKSFSPSARGPIRCNR